VRSVVVDAFEHGNEGVADMAAEVNAGSTAIAQHNTIGLKSAFITRHPESGKS
jgi:hypothetical protein